MKRFASLLLAITIVFSSFAGMSVVSSAVDLPANGQIGENVFYTFDSQTGLLTISGNGDMYDYSRYSKPFDFQETIKTVQIDTGVTNIGTFVFFNCINLSSITISNTVKSIDDYAFWGCESLTSIIIPCSVTNMGNRVFEECKNLKEITIPNIENLIEIKCNNGWTETTIGTFFRTGIEKINFLGTPDEWVKRYLFPPVKCISFNGVIYNEIELNAEKIAKRTFNNNEDIQNLTLSASVKRMEETSFNSCTNLKQITIPYQLISYTFDEWHYNSETINEFFIGFNNSPIEKITFNDNPTEITNKFNSLFKHETLKEFEIPNSVSYIGDAAFKDCKNLTTVTIPKSVTRIEHNAFSGCTNLTVRGYKDSYADTFCKWAGIPFEVIEEPHIHSFAATVTAPTCTEQGFTTHTCSCGESYVDTYISALGHNTEAKTVVKPTGIQLGYTVHSCSHCGEMQKVDTYTAPTGKLTLIHSARTANAIKVQWNNIKTATGYQVQISTKDGKKWSTYATLKAGVNAYTFKNLVAGNNYKFRVRFYIKAADGKNYFSPWSTTLNSPTLPSGTALTKLTPAKRAFVAQWKKNATVTGYQVQYSLKANFASAKTITVKNPKLLKATAAKLYAGKYYFVRIRTYKTIEKANYFSAWSQTYKVKTK